MLAQKQIKISLIFMLLKKKKKKSPERTNNTHASKSQVLLNLVKIMRKLIATKWDPQDGRMVEKENEEEKKMELEID